MVKRVDGWQDSTGKIHPTLEAAETTQKRIDRFELLQARYLDRGRYGLNEALYAMAEEWETLALIMK